MDFTFLGGAREVGKSSVLMQSDGLNLVFDSGIKLTEPPTYPMPTDHVDAVFLSHAHLDHCGNMPALHSRHKMPVYSTAVSFELSHMLQHDSIKINKLKGYPPTYAEKDISRMTAGEIHVQHGREYIFHGKAKFTFYDAGHIPGSSGILVESAGKSVFYTGDTHSSDTRLLNKAVYPDHADVVISESTYGDRLHPRRMDVERQFLDEVEETLERGGVALIPVFAIGRTQEVLLLLESPDWTVYLDGMARKASQTILRFPDMLKNHYKLQEAVDNTVWIKNRRDRKKICKEPCIIVTTAGMLEGGPVLDYLSHLHKDANSNIMLTGYQVEDTNGRLLVEKGYVVDEESGQRFNVDMNISQYDFSAHSDKEELAKTVKSMDPEEVFLIHGDEDSVEALKGEFGERNVHTPGIGDKVRIN
ncbi:MAG: MBL fold metallo-hydrolase [Candidatus Altiarchaeales archaeon]|nr:MBL fold metallo-hydrolase [Candidatus Altiarchaeales archaeon]MBD3415877.1 MBL fold metallo-hydrolase [Candidatus Altiarchaeales archaeon]